MTELGFGVLALLAVLGSAALIVIPLVRRRAPSPLLWAERNGVAADEKASAIDALRDLDIDYQLGSLTTEDYRQLQADLRRRALAALKAEDQQILDMDEAIEQAVAAERARRQASPARLPPETGCPYCGEPITGSERFCPACGGLLAQDRQAARGTHSFAASPNGKENRSRHGAATSARALAACRRPGFRFVGGWRLLGGAHRTQSSCPDSYRHRSSARLPYAVVQPAA
jgi:hypothetical protein